MLTGAAARPQREAQSTHELAYQVLHTLLRKRDAANKADLPSSIKKDASDTPDGS